MTDQIQKIQGYEIDFEMTSRASDGLNDLLVFIEDVTEEEGKAPMTIRSNTHDGALVMIHTDTNNAMGEVFEDGTMNLFRVGEHAAIVKILTNEFANRLNSMIRETN